MPSDSCTGDDVVEEKGLSRKKGRLLCWCVPFVLYQEPLVSPPMYPSLFWWSQNADARGKQIELLVKSVGGVV